jgi:hypothetical protein
VRITVGKFPSHSRWLANGAERVERVTVTEQAVTSLCPENRARHIVCVLTGRAFGERKGASIPLTQPRDWTVRTMRGACAALLVLSAACSAWRRTEGQWIPGKSLSADPRILLLPVFLREAEPCQEMTGALLGDLGKKGYKVVGSSAGQESGTASLDRAAKEGFDYVLEGNLTNGDEAELLVKLYEVSSRELVASATHYAHGRGGHRIPRTSFPSLRTARWRESSAGYQGSTREIPNSHLAFQVCSETE